MKRQPPSIRIILLTTVSLLTILITALIFREIYTGWEKLVEIQGLNDAATLSDKLFDTEEKFSIERDIAYSILNAPDANSLHELQAGLQKSRQEVDDTFNEATRALEKYNFTDVGVESRKSKLQFAAIQELRRQIDQAIALPKSERDPAISRRCFDELTDMIVQVQALWMEFIRSFISVDPQVTLHMRLKHFLGIIMDYTGRERSLIGRLLIENVDPTPQEQAKLLQWQGKVELSWNITDTLTKQTELNHAIGHYLKDAESHYFTVYDMVKGLFYVPGAKHGASYPISIDQWFELATETTDSLYALKNAAMQETHRYVMDLESESRRLIAVHGVLLAMALALCFYSFRVITRQVIRPINTMVSALMDAISGKETALVRPAVGRDDEIGKLAQVLYAFQEKVEEIKRTSVMLENYTHALEHSNRELDDFAYIASHDLKEPLRGIHNYSCFLLEDNADKLDKDSTMKLNRLVYLSQRMERLVNDLLYFSRLGRQEIAIQPSDINAIIKDIEKTLAVFLEERHAHIIIPKPLPTITCDQTRVTEVFRNLITNAVKYNDHAEKEVEIGFMESCVSSEGLTHQNVFYVKDNGRGIDTQFYEQIFRIFKRLQASTEEAEEGTGVGLTFVKKIIERHNGKIWLESELSKGTTFYFTLQGNDHDTKRT